MAKCDSFYTSDSVDWYGLVDLNAYFLRVRKQGYR